MKNNKSIRKAIALASVLIILILVIAIVYLFFIDNGNPRYFEPEVENSLLFSKVKNLLSISRDCSGEQQVEESGFHGIIEYNCLKTTIEEADYIMDSILRIYGVLLNQNDIIEMENKYGIKIIDDRKDLSEPINGHLYSFDDENIKVYIGEARYTPIIVRLGYGWLHYEGNHYEMEHDRESAKEKPNYRYYYFYCICKDDCLYIFKAYCNTSSIIDVIDNSVRLINSITDV